MKSSDLLLIEGKPGSGKSTLMKYFQRSLSKREPSERKIVASFYYSYREGEQQTNHSNMLRSVLHGLLDQNELFFFHFQPYYRQATQGGRHPKWSYESLKETLLSLIENHPVREGLYLIVDAMDESDDAERIDVIKFLHELCAAKGLCIVKVFVASRPIRELYRFSAKYHKMIRLEDVNAPDILKYAESFLSKLQLPSDIIFQAKEYIVQQAQGVFVWVHLVQKELDRYANGCTRNEIFGFLKSLPTELEGFYKRILMQLEGGISRDIEVGQRMLLFVLFTYRPLELEELRQALAVQDSLGSEHLVSDELLKGNLIYNMDNRLVSCTGNFLQIKGVQGISIR